MPCLTIPVPTLPTLPSPLSLSPPPLPPIPNLPNICCKLPPLPISIPPIRIPSLILNPAIIATLNGYIAAAQAYLVAMPIACPIE